MYLELAFSKQEPLQRASVKMILVRQDLGDLAKAVANTDKRVRALDIYTGRGYGILPCPHLLLRKRDFKINLLFFASFLGFYQQIIINIMCNICVKSYLLLSLS